MFNYIGGTFFSFVDANVNSVSAALSLAVELHSELFQREDPFNHPGIHLGVSGIHAHHSCT